MNSSINISTGCWTYIKACHPTTESQTCCFLVHFFLSILTGAEERGKRVFLVILHIRSHKHILSFLQGLLPLEPVLAISHCQVRRHGASANCTPATCKVATFEAASPDWNIGFRQLQRRLPTLCEIRSFLLPGRSN